MLRFRLLVVPLALVLSTNPALAQRWGGSPPSASTKPAAQVKAASGGAWNGTASKWGGSPVQSPATSQLRIVYVIPQTVYIPVATAAPAPDPSSYVVDTVYSSQTSPVEMRVVRSVRAESQPTTMDVYRQQARFAKPQPQP
jgi:hypothetical protein